MLVDGKKIERDPNVSNQKFSECYPNYLIQLIHAKLIIQWLLSEIYDMLNLDENIPICLNRTGIRQDLIEDFIDDDDIDRFAQDNEILKDYILCSYLQFQIMDEETGKWRVEALLPLFNGIRPEYQLLLMKVGGKCSLRKKIGVPIREHAWQVALCMKRNDPLVNV